MIIILNASKVTYTSNGTQTVFSFPFDYLCKRFISVTAGDTALVYGTHYSVTNKEVMLANAVASGTLIVIERTTPTTRLVEWQDASVLTANDMTISEVQNLHILEEQNTFILNNAIYLNEDKVWEGRNKRIANVSDPINDQDVVTLGYVNKNETGLLTKLKNAYDTYMADLLDKYTQYKDTLLSNYSSYTSNLKDDFNNYTASMLAKYNEYMTSMLNTKNTYLANLKTKYDEYMASLLSTKDNYLASLKSKYDEYMDSLTQTITTASTTITGYMDTTKGYMDTAGAKATVATDKATEATTQADRAEHIADGLSALNGVTGVATEAEATAGTSETLVMTPKTTKSVTTVLSDALTAFKGVVNKAGIGITTNNNATPNIDTVDSTGFYCIINPQDTLPDGITGGELLHIQFDASQAHQMLFESDPSFADRYYIRTKAKGTWNAWRQFTKQGDTHKGNLIGSVIVPTGVPELDFKSTDFNAGFYVNNVAKCCGMYDWSGGRGDVFRYNQDIDSLTFFSDKFQVKRDGSVEICRFLDMHAGSVNDSDYKMRLATDGNSLFASGHRINPVVGYVGNNSSGYIRYKNGYCVQWGSNDGTASATRSNFYIGYATNPIVVASALTNGAEGTTGSQSNPCIRNIDTSGFYFCHYDTGNHFAGHTWAALGHVQPV